MADDATKKIINYENLTEYDGYIKSYAKTAVDGEATAREEAIAAEKAERERADTATNDLVGELTDTLTAEMTARAAADTALSGDISTETSAREEADNTLTQSITDEATARETKDTELEDAINALSGTVSSDLTVSISEIKEALAQEVTDRGDADDAIKGTIASIQSAEVESVTANMDNSTYVVTIGLVNASGTTVSTASIDLPLEATVVGGSYDTENKSVVLTLTSGSEISFPIADLIDGLASTADLEAETAAREAADEALEASINESVTNIESEIAAANTAIASEATARQEAYDTLATALETETTDRETADTTLTDSLTAEVNARTSADEALTASITAETSARTEQDESLQSQINALTSTDFSAMQEAIETNTGNIQTLTDDLAQEVADRKEADNTITGNVSDLSDALQTETADRKTADTNLQNQITAEVNERELLNSQHDEDIAELNASAVADVKTTFDSETRYVTVTLLNSAQEVIAESSFLHPIDNVVVSGSYADGEVVLTLLDGSTIDFPVSDLVAGLVSQTDYDTDIAALKAKDTELAQAIEDEEDARELADTGLDSAIKAEANTRATEDGILADSIAATAKDLTQEITDRKEAVEGVTAELTQEITDRKEAVQDAVDTLTDSIAETYATQTALTTETQERKDADSALQSTLNSSLKDGSISGATLTLTFNDGTTKDLTITAIEWDDTGNDGQPVYIKDGKAVVANNIYAGSYTLIGQGITTDVSEDVRKTVIGRSATGTGVQCTVVGIYGEGSGQGSTTVGDSGTASGSQSTNVGARGTASGSQSTNVGASGTASGSQSTNIGVGGNATSEASISFGLYAQSTATYSISIGRWSYASADYSISITSGLSTTVQGTYDATCTYAITVGYRALSTGSGAVVIGANAQAGANGIALGANAVAGDNEIALGNKDLGSATQGLYLKGGVMTAGSEVATKEEFDSLSSKVDKISGYVEDALAELDKNSWEIISKVSQAGLAASYWSVGDTKTITVSGTVGTLSVSDSYNVYILGFNHNSTYEGSNTIHFGCFKTTGGVDVALVDSCYGSSSIGATKYFNMNHSGNNNYGGWAACDMRYDILGSTNVNPQNYGSAHSSGDAGYNPSSTCATSPVGDTLMAALPSDLRAVMKPMTKYTDNVAGATNVAGNISATTDYLPLLAEYEVQGTRSYANTYEKNYQAQYDYYKNGNSKIKYQHSASSTTCFWWLRSAYYSYSNYFCGVVAGGGAGSGGANNARALAPAFCI